MLTEELEESFEGKRKVKKRKEGQTPGADGCLFGLYLVRVCEYCVGKDVV